MCKNTLENTEISDLGAKVYETTFWVWIKLSDKMSFLELSDNCVAL